MRVDRFPRISRRRAFGARAAVFLAALVMLVPYRGFASPKNGPPWIEKDWTQWTFIDCENILKDSPWASSSEGDYGGFTFGGGFQLVSALPMRQATIRYARLRDGYEKMSASKKSAYDAKHPEDLSDSDTRAIVIQVRNVACACGRVAFSSMPGPFPAGQAVLKLSDGTVVAPLATTGKIEEHWNNIQYTFPRIVNGSPAYTENDKSIELFFGGSLWVDKKGNVLPREQQAFPLDPKDEIKIPIAPMVYKGKLEY